MMTKDPFKGIVIQVVTEISQLKPNENNQLVNYLSRQALFTEMVAYKDLDFTVSVQKAIEKCKAKMAELNKVEDLIDRVMANFPAIEKGN